MSTYTFKQPTENFTCGVCLSVFVNPVSLGCGHTLCQTCLESLRKASGAKFLCPECRHPCDSAEKRSVSVVLKNVIAAMEVKCNGCSKEMLFEAYDKHELECPANKCHCKDELLGCDHFDHPSKTHDCIFASASQPLRVALWVARFGASDVFDYATKKKDEDVLKPAAKRSRVASIHSKMMTQLDEWFFGSDEPKRTFACEVMISLFKSPMVADVNKHFDFQQWFKRFWNTGVSQGVTLIAKYFILDKGVFLQFVFDEICLSPTKFLDCMDKILSRDCIKGAKGAYSLMQHVDALLKWCFSNCLEKIGDKVLQHPSFLKMWIECEHENFSWSTNFNRSILIFCEKRPDIVRSACKFGLINNEMFAKHEKNREVVERVKSIPILVE